MEKHTDNAAAYREFGLALFQAFLTSEEAKRTANLLSDSGRYISINQPNVYTRFGESKHDSIDRFAVCKIIKGIEDIYDRAYQCVLTHVDERAFKSPYERSAYYAKRYMPPSGEQGWHHDTNCISAVLYLSDNFEGQTEVICRDGLTRTIHPQAGKLLLLDGTRLWHRAAPVKTEEKTTLIMNFYTPDHKPRPDWLDAKIFGS